MQTKRIILAVSGASGMRYAMDLAQTLAPIADAKTHLIISDAARTVMLHEGIDSEELISLADTTHSQNDIAAPPASGSWIHHGMVVCPCSMATLAAIANGLGTNLMHRTADTCLKEGRKLILVPRETPLNTIHLENMLKANRAGAIILPACPGFYHKPETISDLTSHLAGKILDQLDIPHNLFKRWGE